MIEGFIVIIISLLFWGKVSKDALENNPKFDIIKTIVYLVLSFVVAVIYYKSSLVEKSTNYFEIRKLAGVTADDGTNTDSVSIVVNHRMNPNSIRNVLSYEHFNPLGGIESTFKSRLSNHKLVIDSTNLKILYGFINDCMKDADLYKEIPKDNYLLDVINRYIEEREALRPQLVDILTQFNNPNPVFSKSDSIQMIDALNYILKDLRHLYVVSHIPPQRKTFLPINIREKDEIHFDSLRYPSTFCVEFKKFQEKVIYNEWRHYDLDENKLSKEFDTRNLTCYQFYLGSSEIDYKGPDSLYIVKLNSSDSLFNYIDYFTSSDMSQRIFDVEFYSEVPLKSLSITFDEPISLSEIYPKPDTLGMTQIVYTDKKKLDYFKNRGLIFHAHFPTYENKRLLRSLILTTILTAVFSLFCTNLYILGRTLIRRFIRTRTITEEEKEKYKKRLSIYHWACVAIAMIIAVIPIWLYCLLIKNDPIFISSEKLTPTIIVIVLCFLALFAGLFIWKKNLIPHNKNTKEQNRSSEEE